MKMVMKTLATMPSTEDFEIPASCVAFSEFNFRESVLTIPVSPTSYIHENIKTAGKPKIATTTRSLKVHSGIRSAGIIIVAACNSTNAVARYMAALLKTLRFFNSAMKFDIMNGYELLYRNLAKGVSLNQIKQNYNR